VCFIAVEVVEFAHAIARVLKRKENRARRRATFGIGIATLLSFFFPQFEPGSYCVGFTALAIATAVL
jgi:hypothetical protein